MTITEKELLSKSQAKLSIQRAISYERRLGALSTDEIIAVLESAIGDLKSGDVSA